VCPDHGAVVPRRATRPSCPVRPHRHHHVHPIGKHPRFGTALATSHWQRPVHPYLESRTEVWSRCPRAITTTPAAPRPRTVARAIKTRRRSPLAQDWRAHRWPPCRPGRLSRPGGEKVSQLSPGRTTAGHGNGSGTNRQGARAPARDDYNPHGCVADPVAFRGCMVAGRRCAGEMGTPWLRWTSYSRCRIPTTLKSHVAVPSRSS